MNSRKNAAQATGRQDKLHQPGFDPGARTESVPGYPSHSLVIFLAFLAFVVARYIQLGARRDILATVRIELLLGIGVIILTGYALNIRRPEIGTSKPLLGLIAALFLAMILQLPMAAAPQIANIVFMDRVIKFAVMTFVMIALIESPKYLGWFLATFLFSVFYITLESVEGLISGGLVWQNQGIMRLHGAVPIYEHPNSLGGVAMGTLPFVVFLLPHVRRRILQLGLLATATTSMICVIYSGSRTAYLGLLAFVLWWWFQTAGKWKFLFYGALFSVLAIQFIPPEYIERFESIGGEEAEGHSKEARLTIMQDAWTILLENPLGVGVASFPTVRKARFGRHQDTHNLYLEVATNLGIQGFLVFSAMVIVMLFELRRVMFGFRNQRFRTQTVALNKRLPRPLRKTAYEHDLDLQFLAATAKAAAGFIITRLVLGFFGMDLYEVYWWFGAGLTIVLSGIAIRVRRRSVAIWRLAASTQGD